MGEVSYNWIGMDGFEVKSETGRFTVVCPRCRKNLTFGDFTLLFFLWSTPNKCTEVRAAHAARLFFLF